VTEQHGRPPKGGSGVGGPGAQRFELRTPAERLPPAPMSAGVVGEILERLAVIEDQLGISRRRRKPHEPLPGSDVQPLGSEGD